MKNPSYKTIAASQTDSELGTKAGDYLDRLIIIVATAANSKVELQDGSGSAFEVFPDNPGGGIGTYVVPVKMTSRRGGWSVTTDSGVAVIAVGDFTI